MKFIPSQINVNPNKTVWVVDDFYKDPHAVREFALKQKFSANPESTRVFVQRSNFLHQVQKKSLRGSWILR